MFSQIILYLMSACLVIGGIDSLLGNRWGLGRKFEEGFQAFGTLFVMMGGVIVLLPAAEKCLLPVAHLAMRLGLDPAVLSGMLLANDTGGFFLARSLSGDSVSVAFGGMLLGSVMGVNVIFNIPVSLKMIEEKDYSAAVLGYLYGIITIPAGCIAGALCMRMPVGTACLLLWPAVLVSCVIAIALRFFPHAMIACMTFFGKAVTWIATAAIVGAIAASLLGYQNLLPFDTVENAAKPVLTIVMLLPGAYVLMELLKRGTAQITSRLGRKIGINESSVLGLVSSLANTVPTFSLVKNMDKRGIVLNFAFLVSASFAFGDHLAFCAAVAPRLLFPMIATKITGAAAAIVVAWLALKHHGTTAAE